MSKGNYCQVGVIHNKSKGVKEDVIRMRMVSTKSGHGMECNMRVDEAMTLVSGLSKTLTRMIYLDKKHIDLFVKSAKLLD